MGVMRTKPGGKKEPYGPNIVRAWFDTVFRYALQGLGTEFTLLANRSWTFRFNTRTLEYIGPLTEHLSAPAKENLDQFIHFFPQVGEKISEHDQGCRQLENSCLRYWTAIQESELFRRVFEEVASEAPVAFGREFNCHFGAYSSEEDFKGTLAEYLVNNVDLLPSYYSTAELWNRYRDRFLQVTSTPALEPFRTAVEREGQNLLDAVNALSMAFKDTRSELSLRFDVPV